MSVRKLSSVSAEERPLIVEKDTTQAILLVGSYAPVHEGHFDAMRSAERALRLRGDTIGATVFAPNSDSYVLSKLADEQGVWNFDRRIAEFEGRAAGTLAPSFVDDITGTRAPEKSISDTAIDTASEKLGIRALNMILVVGTDQIASMQSHLETNRAICILRPGYEAQLAQHLTQGWLVDAIDTGRYVLAEREHLDRDISATDIRRALGFGKATIL